MEQSKSFLTDPLFQRANIGIIKQCKKVQSWKSKLNKFDLMVKTRPLDYYRTWVKMGFKRQITHRQQITHSSIITKTLTWKLHDLAYILEIIRNPEMPIPTSGELVRERFMLSDNNIAQCLEVFMIYELIYCLSHLFQVPISDWGQTFDKQYEKLTDLPCKFMLVKRISKATSIKTLKRVFKSYNVKDRVINEIFDFYIHRVSNNSQAKCTNKIQHNTKKIQQNNQPNFNECRIYFISKFNRELDSLLIENKYSEWTPISQWILNTQLTQTEDGKYGDNNLFSALNNASSSTEIKKITLVTMEGPCELSDVEKRVLRKNPNRLENQSPTKIRGQIKIWSFQIIFESVT